MLTLPEDTLRTPILLCCALALLAGTGCESGSSQPLRISGDTLIAVNNIVVDGVPQAAECAATFGAYVDEDGVEARIVSGRLTWTYADGEKASESTWSAENIETMWPQNTITKEKPQASMRIPLGMSLPFHPLRGEAVFQYVVGEDDEPRTAEPFHFQCR